MPNLFLQFFVVAFLMASIVGPISILCIKRTLSHGAKVGVASTLGATSVETFYFSVAAYGITFISDFLTSQQFILRICGGSFLFYLGAKALLAKLPKQSADKVKKKTLLVSYVSVVALTLANPLTIISMLAIFASFDFFAEAMNPFAITTGFACGSLVSYAILIAVASFLKKKSSDNFLKILNKFSGLLICGFAIYAFAGAFH